MGVETKRKSSSRMGPARAVLVACVIGTGLASSVLGGCAVSETDVKRWEGTERGPMKLVAVLTHDKYRPELRVEAALSLVRMRPRGGKKVGFTMLFDKYKDDEGNWREGALKQLDEESRKTIVNGMAPTLVKEMESAPPPRTPEGRLPEDPSIPYKDAAFAMLSNEPTLVGDENTRKELSAALVKWVQAGFEDRLENSSQQYSVEQMMRFLGPGSVRSLPALINESANRLDRIAGLINEIGEPETKLKASEALVVLAKKLTTAEWGEAQKKVVKEYNEKSNVKANDAQVAQQVDKMLDRRLTEEVFVAMKKVGGRPAIEYLIEFAADPKNKEDRRKLALAALEGRMDKGNTKDLEHVFAIAKEESTPDSVRDVAFQRLGEYPKEAIVPKLYTVFDSKKWKVRWVAASMILDNTTAKGVPDFMEHMPKNDKVKMGMTEPLSFGQKIAKMADSKPVIAQYLQSKVIGPKVVALGSFYEGHKADIAQVQPFENDTALLPNGKCEPTDECDWKVNVPKAGGKPDETEPKELKTVGDLVKYAIIPSMSK